MERKVLGGQHTRKIPACRRSQAEVLGQVQRVSEEELEQAGVWA